MTLPGPDRRAPGKRQWNLGSDARLPNQADRALLSSERVAERGEAMGGRQREGEVKNMIFSLLGARPRRVSGIS